MNLLKNRKKMKSNIKIMAILALASVFVMSSCNDKDDERNDDTNVVGNETILKGTITKDVTLKAGNTYKLSGEYIVESGATLNIEPGVKIIAVYDDIVDYILVKQGAKINAIGTSSAPIVMTSEREEPGAWGGIHICGYARTNAKGGRGLSEIGGAQYGGTDDNDNSGVFRYVRVEYTGYAFDEEHEANGITFYGVGRGTQVDHCQAYKGSDDGFEFFGGTVNISDMLVTSCSDDSYDWTEGWSGRGTNLAAYQEPEATLGYACDCLIEADNNENNYAATPTSHPTLNNIILVGNGGEHQGIRLRRGTQVSINGAQVMGKGKCLAVESEPTETALVGGISVLQNMTIATEVDSKEGIYTNATFLSQGNKVDMHLSMSYNELLSKAVWTAGWTK